MEGAPLKPGFGLSGGCSHVTDLVPTDKLDCPHAMGPNAFSPQRAESFLHFLLLPSPSLVYHGRTPTRLKSCFSQSYSSPTHERDALAYIAHRGRGRPRHTCSSTAFSLAQKFPPTNRTFSPSICHRRIPQKTQARGLGIARALSIARSIYGGNHVEHTC